MPIGQPFNSQFQDGDVLYGITWVRHRYVCSLSEGRARRLRSAGLYHFIDSYNKHTFGEHPHSLKWANADSPRDRKDNPKFQKDDPRLLTSEQHIKFNLAANRSTSDLNPQQKDALAKYYNALSGTRYAPLEAVKVDLAKVMEKGNIDYPQFLFRRAAKFGIAYVIEWLAGPGPVRPTLHFCLDHWSMNGDSLNFADIVAKGRHGEYGAVPVTTSELRCLYRNRYSLLPTGSLKFYLNYVEVPPPWFTDHARWNIYEEHRIAKGKVERTRL